ncbi:hypothetical protein F5887DRAFT_940235 [Amanita rubescens]|nr:hypothetical protein F5887DRAFT_940235 [Amanita rubescens]
MAPAHRASKLDPKRILLVKESNSVAKETTPTQRPSSTLKADDEYTAIPIPIPDTGFRPTLAQVPAFSPSPTTETMTSFATGSTLTHLAGSIVNRPSSLTSAQLSATGPLDLPPSPTRSVVNAASPLQRSFSSTVVGLLAVGSACLVLLIFILIRSCTRPKHRPRLTPSLPILDEEYLVDLESKESPIFGGKERLSPKIDSWITLDPAMSRPPRAAKFGVGAGVDDYTVSRSPRPQDKASYPDCMSVLPYSRTDRCTSLLEKGATSVYQAPYQHVQKAITQTIKRLSTMSSSLYPGTPLPCEVGIALGGQETPLTGDGYSVMSRSKSKNIKSKDYQIGQSYELAYDTLNVDSTSTVVCEHATTAPLLSAKGGRTRIKSSYYAPGIHSRISAIPTSMTTPGAGKKALHDKATEKPDSRQDKDRRSLTLALGLASPSINEIPLSPFTLYPDDSLSVVDQKESDEGCGATNSGHLPSSLTSDPGANLSTQLLSHSRGKSVGDTINASSLRLEGKTNASHESRIHDKPPRVPSPPPLPSLAQMAMEHHNREGFESYQSPTYSIYGLYGGERTSFGVMYR